MVRGALLAILASSLVLPGVSADPLVLDPAPELPLVVPVEASLQASTPRNDECIGFVGGDDYIDHEEYPNGGFSLFVGVPIGRPLAAVLDTTALDMRTTGPVQTGQDWVGVGVKFMGPGCEVIDLSVPARTCVTTTTTGDGPLSLQEHPDGSLSVFAGVPDPANPGNDIGAGATVDC